MLVLLRQNQTKLYYGVHGEWVAKSSAAAHFDSIEEALLANRQAHLQGTEVLVVHSNGGRRVVLPIGKQSWTSHHWNVVGTAVHSRNKNQNSGARNPASWHKP